MMDIEIAQRFLDGALYTVRIFAIAWVMAFSLGLLLATLRATRIRILENIVICFTEYHRNVPLLVHVFFWYFGMPELLPEDMRMWLYRHNAEMSLATIALALGASAYLAEDFRSGIRSIPSTQFEGARSLGATYFQTMRYVVLPQALRNSIPSLVGRALLLFKNTSITMAIGVPELTYQAREIENETFRTFFVFGIATLLYLAGSYLIMGVGKWLESKYALKGGRA